MLLENIFIFCITSFGLTFLVKDSKIFAGARRWLTTSYVCTDCNKEPQRGLLAGFFHKLFQCTFCVGTWTGLFLGTLIIISKWPLNWLDVCGYLIIYSMLSATASYIIDLFTQKLEQWVSN